MLLAEGNTPGQIQRATMKNSEDDKEYGDDQGKCPDQTDHLPQTLFQYLQSLLQTLEGRGKDLLLILNHT